MKRIVLMLATVLAAGVAASSASATGPLLVQEGVLCGVFNADGNIVLTTDSELIWYASGKVALRCEADTVNNSGSRVVFSGFLCGLGPFGFTTQSRNTIGVNGRSQLTCTGHANPGDAAASAAAGSYGAG